jgi:hypothetical protein
MIAFLTAMLAAPVSGEGVGVGVGDYWEYSFGGDVEGLTMDGLMTQTVVSIDGDVFVIEQTGSGTVSGTAGDITLSGDLDMSGVSHRQVSDFSMVFNSLAMTMTMSGADFSLDVSLGTEYSYSPAMDDYIGDGVLAVGGSSTSSSTVTIDTWYEVMGMNETYSVTEDATLTMEIVDANVSVTTDAGTFDCYKVEATGDVGNESLTLVSYYSEEVGNYVKIAGDENPLLGLSNMELKSYSYAAGESSAGILDGPTMLILVIVVIAALVIVALALVMRSRKKTQMPPMMPPQETPPQPPQVPPPPPPAQ